MAPPTAIDVQGTEDTQAATVIGPLSINGVPARRAKAAPLARGVAPHTSSDMFKGPQHSKPRAKRWDHLINQESKARKPSSLKAAAQYLKQPGLISLGGGLPSSENFPLERVDIKIPRPPHFSEQQTIETGIVKSIGKRDIANEKSLYDLHVALNYGQGTGSPQLLRFVTEHTEIIHQPPYADWQCILNSGSTSALDIAFRMLTERGDLLLTEEYAFCSAVETAAPMGVGAVGIKMDAEGLIPSEMDHILSAWDPSTRKGAAKPKILYTVPSGQNPTGATQGLQRRRDLYAVCQKHDIYIIEDEPYFFLQMQPYTGPDAPQPPPPASHAEFITSLVPSLLSMDVDGRVMRLDSFSKVISPGTRTGWVTASEQIIERFIRHHEVSTQNPSGLSQIILYKMLDETWGHEGYLDWLIALRMEYTARRDVLLDACEKHVPKSVASWDPPMAGMFHWMTVHTASHPSVESGHPKTLLEIEEEIFLAGIAKGVLTSRGSWFRAEGPGPLRDTIPTADPIGGRAHVPNGNINGKKRDADGHVKEPVVNGDANGEVGVGVGGKDDRIYFRTTFAAASSKEVAEAIRRFGEALREVFELDKVQNGVGK